MLKIIRISIVLVFSLFVLPFNFAQLLAVEHGKVDKSCFSTDWPHEKSKLQPDPSVIFGRLANGFRYVLKQNTFPQDRVALFLNVQAGSLNENENERGYAHYLEHMLFNGSTHFPPGSLISYFQSIGMSFGADTNAHTSFDETVYKLFLPKGEINTVKKGLTVMLDYAQGALLLGSEVVREKGVILAEKTARDSMRYRTRIAKNKKAFEGMLLPDRSPIGIEETIENATSEKLRSFYDNWYRPKNMILVVVGDFDVDQVEKEIHEKFSSMQGRGVQPQCPDIGKLSREGIEAFYHYEPHTGSVKVSIESYWNSFLENDSLDVQNRDLKEYIATYILRKRLEKIAEGNPQFSFPQVYSGNMLEGLKFTGMTAYTSASQWQESFTTLENSLRQILNFGITETELEIAKREILTYFESQVLTASSRKSSRIARHLIQSLNKNRVYLSPKQQKEIALMLLENMNIKDIHNAMLNLWGRDNRLLSLSGNIEIEGVNPEKKLLRIYSSAKNNAVVAYDDGQRKRFPYLVPSDKPLKPISKTYHPEIDTHIYLYDNGTILNLKQTSFEKNKVKIVIRFGMGKIGETAPGLAMLAESVINSSGSKELTSAEIRDALAGSTVEYDLEINTSTIELHGESLSNDIELLIQTLYTVYTHPGVREKVYKNKIKRYEQMYQSLQNDVWGVDALFVNGFFSGGNKLYTMAKWEDVEKIQFHQLKEWVKKQFTDVVPEISVVGDFDVDEILSIVNKYYGPQKVHQKPTVYNSVVEFPTNERLDISIPTEVDKTLIVFGWKTSGLGDIHVSRRLHVLASLLEERLREIVREKLGASYSPSVYNYSSRVIKGYGTMYIKIVTEEKFVSAVQQAVDDVIRNIAATEIGEDELQRIKQPLLTSLKDRVQTNSYWLNAVLAGSAENPEQLTWPTTLFQDNEDIRSEELQDLAKKYLDPQKNAMVIIRPEAK